MVKMFFGGDQIFGKRADSVKPGLVGSRKQILERRKNESAEFSAADSGKPAVCAETLHSSVLSAIITVV